jgi:hypothetical protein
MALRRRLLTPLPQVSIWVHVDWRASEAGHGIAVMRADLAAAPYGVGVAVTPSVWRWNSEPGAPSTETPTAASRRPAATRSGA